MIFGLIFIDKKNFIEVKIEIYYQTIEVIMECKSNCDVLRKFIWPNITILEKMAIEGLLIICTNRNVQ